MPGSVPAPTPSGLVLFSFNPIRWEARVQDFQEFCSNISFHVNGEWGVKIDTFSPPIFPPTSRNSSWFKL